MSFHFTADHRQEETEYGFPLFNNIEEQLDHEGVLLTEEESNVRIFTDDEDNNSIDMDIEMSDKSSNNSMVMAHSYLQYHPYQEITQVPDPGSNTVYEKQVRTGMIRDEYKCHKCGKKYTYHGPFYKHIVERKCVQEYNCARCGKGYKKKCWYMKHMRSCNKAVSYFE